MTASFLISSQRTEFPIIMTIPFDKVDIKIMGIESPHLGKLYPGSFPELTKYLSDQGYDYFFQCGDDITFSEKNMFKLFIDKLKEHNDLGVTGPYTNSIYGNVQLLTQTFEIICKFLQ